MALCGVLDENATRTGSLYGTHAAQPILYAFDAESLRLLWKNSPGKLFPSGKYNEPTVVNGTVYVGTNNKDVRLQRTQLKAATEFTPLFDGKTLKHWRGDPALWSVENGAITGRTKTPNEKNTFLIHDGTYRDFEIRFKYRFATTWGNSGLQYRSRPYAEHKILGCRLSSKCHDARREGAFRNALG